MFERLRKWLWRNRIDVAIAIVLFIVAAVPRMTDLGTFLTADEKNWMGRSYEFIRAVKDWRFNDTLQTTHPGVTTLWVSGAAITAKMFLSHTPFSFQNLAHFAAAAQFPIALATSLAVPVMYLFLRRLFQKEPRFATPEEQATASTSGVSLPFFAALFIALNPLLIGYSRVAHVDALLSSLMFLAALATMIYAQGGYKRGWLVTAAVLSGLAILTKAPAVFLLPFLVLVVLVYEFTAPHPTPLLRKERVIQRLRDMTLWLLIVGLMFLILWPAMLFVPDPKGNALILKRDLGAAALTPHHMAEDYTLNSYHYPFALLTRTNPVTLVFGGLAIFWLLLKIPMSKPPTFAKASAGRQIPVRELWLLASYVFFFVLMMTLIAKKGDRYILPVFPALDVLAAFGILMIGSLFAKLRIRNWKLPPLILASAAVLYLAGVTAYYHPYAIAYSNPSFRDNLSQELGWGEGLEQVAAWLNEHDPEAIVASWYPEELGAYTSAHVAHINAHEQSKVRYIVLYRNMFGRAPDHYANNFIDEYYKKREPVFVAHVAGKEFAWVYEKWVFDRIVGELLPGVRVEQEIPVTHDGLSGLDIMIATYSGRAKVGDLVVTVKKQTGEDLHEWRVPVHEIQDDRWLTLKLSQPQNLQGQDVLISIQAVGTSAQNAPTIRYSSDRNYRESTMMVSGEARKGDLAIRLRYRVGNQEATEEDTRLLK